MTENSPPIGTILDLLDTYDPVQGRQGVALLNRIGMGAVGPLITLLRAESNPSPRVHWATEALGQLGAVAVDPLLHLLDDDDPIARGRAAAALGLTGDSRIIGPVAATLCADQDRWVRARSAYALGWVHDSRAVRLLIDALDDPDHLVRSEAAEALVRLGDLAIVPAREVLQDAERPDHVRTNAAWVLGKLSHAGAFET